MVKYSINIYLFKETTEAILRRLTVDVVIVLVATSERTSCLFLNQTFMVKDTPPSLYRVWLVSL